MNQAPQAWRPQNWSPLRLFIALFVLYWLLATSAYELFGALTIGVTFFPAAGLTFAAFYTLPRRHWLVIAAAIVAGELAVNLGRGQGLWWSLGWAAANLGEPLVGALVALRFGGVLDVSRRSAAAVVAGGLVIGPAVGASIGATTLSIANDLDWMASFADVWVGDSLGVLIVAPAALLFAVVPAGSWPRGRDLTVSAVLAVIVLAMCLLFWTSDEPAVAYASIPLLAFCAMRTGPRGLALAAAAIAAAATSATAHGHGPWQRIVGADVQDQLGHQQFFLLVAVGGAWLLIVEARERARVVEDLIVATSTAAERKRAFELEREARRRADARAQMNAAIGLTLDLDDLANRVVNAAVPALCDGSTLTLTFEQHREPSIVAEAGDAPAPDDHPTIVVRLPSPLGDVGTWELRRSSSSAPHSSEDAWLVEELAGIIGSAVNSGLLHRGQLRAQRALDALQHVTGTLASAATVDQIIDAVVSHSVVGVAADSAMLFVREEHSLRLAGTAGLEHLDIGPWQELPLTGSSPVVDAVRDRKVVLLSDVPEMRGRYPAMRLPAQDRAAVIALPLYVQNNDVGALVLTFRRAHVFHDEELAMLETLAGRCAGAIVRARLYETQRTAALALQRRLLPELPVVPAWLDVGARYEPASGGQVGGDWYQVMMLDDGRCVAALGDAVGRGITAAAAMGQLRAAIAGAAEVDAHPSRVVSATSRLAAAGADTRCASLAYAVMDPELATVTYALAGHHSPVLIRSSGEVELLDAGRSPLLGVVPSTGPAAHASTRFDAGDTLIFYSDGLIERRGESIDEGLLRLVTHATELAHLPSAASLAFELVHAAVEHDIDDDVAVLVIRRQAC